MSTLAASSSSHGAHHRTRASSASASATAPSTTKPMKHQHRHSRRRPVSAHASISGPSSTGFAPSSALRPILPLSIDVSLAQIALPPSSLVHKPPIVLPIAIDGSQESLSGRASHHEVKASAQAVEAPAASSSSSSKGPKLHRRASSASSPSGAAYPPTSSSDAISTNSADGSFTFTPRPCYFAAQDQEAREQSAAQRRNSLATPIPIYGMSSAQPQHEVLALLSDSKLDTAGIISPPSCSPRSSSSSASSSSSEALSRSGSGSSFSVEGLESSSTSSSTQSSYVRNSSLPAIAWPSTSTTGSTTKDVPDSYRPRYARSASVTSFASDGSWHGDAGDWDPETQLRAAAEAARRSQSQVRPESCTTATSAPKPISRSTSSTSLFRSIGAGLSAVSDRVSRSHQRQQDDASEDEDESESGAASEQDEDESPGSTSAPASLFSSQAPSARSSFSHPYSMSDAAETASSFSSFSNFSAVPAASSRYHLRFKSLGQGLTPLRPVEHKHKEDESSALNEAGSTDEPAARQGQTKPEALPQAPPSPKTKATATALPPSAPARRTARDSIKEHAGPFIWLLSGLFDPVSDSLALSASDSSLSSTRSANGGVGAANEEGGGGESVCSPDMGCADAMSPVMDGGDMATFPTSTSMDSMDGAESLGLGMGSTGLNLKRRPSGPLSGGQEDYLFGPLEAWATLRALSSGALAGASAEEEGEEGSPMQMALSPRCDVSPPSTAVAGAPGAGHEVGLGLGRLASVQS